MGTQHRNGKSKGNGHKGEERRGNRFQPHEKGEEERDEFENCPHTCSILKSRHRSSMAYVCFQCLQEKGKHHRKGLPDGEQDG